MAEKKSALPWPETTYGHVWFEPSDEYANAQGELPPPGYYSPNQTPKIADHNFAIDSELAALADSATQKAQQFDAEYGEVVAPFSSIILRSEAAASSEIENLSASARSILQAELGDTSRENAVQIAANVRAMRTAIENNRGVNLTEILAIHKTLLEGERSMAETAGHLRTSPVWIGGQSRFKTPVGAKMAGVVPEHIEASLEDLAAFAARKDVPALVKAAIVHAQFENIHPFEDGNGRTGRALVTTMLRSDGVMHNVTVPISAAILAESDEYYRALTLYRQGDAGPIVHIFADATNRSIDNGRLLGDDLVALRSKWREQVEARSDSGVWALTELLLGQPVLTAETISISLGISLKSAYAHGDKLEKSGILTSSKHKGVLQWRSEEMLEALDRFGSRAGFRKPGTY
jgi:Fic family protein